MGDSAKRYFLIIVGIVGAIFSGVLIVTSVKSGTVPGPSMAWWVTGSGYAAAAHPSQYWFMLFIFIAGVIGFAWLAWHAYRN